MDAEQLIPTSIHCRELLCTQLSVSKTVLGDDIEISFYIKKMGRDFVAENK